MKKKFFKATLNRVLIDNYINVIQLVMKKHRCSLSREEIGFLEQSVTLLKEYKKAGGDSKSDLQMITLQVTEILLRFLFSDDCDRLEDLF